MLVLVIGTFLPWLDSGAVSRNSYQAAGALRALLPSDSFARVVLAGWPFTALAAALAVALLVLGHLVAGALLSLATGICTGAVAIWTLAAPAHGLIQPATWGPVVTLLGSTVASLTATVTLIVLARSPRGTR